MIRLIPCLMLLALTGLARADEKEAEAKVKHLLELMSKSIPVLEGIKDRESAEKAKPDLTKIFDEMEKLARDFSKTPDEVKKKLEAAYKPKFEEQAARYRKEIERLRKEQAVVKVLGDIGPFKSLENQKEVVVRFRTLALDGAVKAYQLQNGNFPEKLEDLAAGEKPLVEKASLKDPWGKAYQYDAAGPKNKGAKPDIWTTDPSGKVIGNWDAKPTPKDK